MHIDIKLKGKCIVCGRNFTTEKNSSIKCIRVCTCHHHTKSLNGLSNTFFVDLLFHVFTMKSECSRFRVVGVGVGKENWRSLPLPRQPQLLLFPTLRGFPIDYSIHKRKFFKNVRISGLSAFNASQVYSSFPVHVSVYYAPPYFTPVLFAGIIGITLRINCVNA